MIVISGNFASYSNNIYRVTITIPNDKYREISIGEMEDRYHDCVYFSDDPVEITYDFTDTFEHIITKNASVTLVTNMDFGSMLVNYNEKAILEINQLYKNELDEDVAKPLFVGYIEPLEWSQPYAKRFETFTLQATDKICRLQYVNYIQELARQESEKDNPDIEIVNKNSLISDIIRTCLVPTGLTLEGYSNTNKIPKEVQNALDILYLPNSLFGGLSEDDDLTCYDVLNEIGKYLNIYFINDGTNCYLYDWHHLNTSDVNLTANDYASNDTNLSLADVYSQIKLECELDQKDTLLDLLDGDTLYSPYVNRQKYLTEIISEGEGDRAWEGFKYYITKDTPTVTGRTYTQLGKYWEDSYLYDHYFQVMKSDLFDSMKYYDWIRSDGKYQIDVLKKMTNTTLPVSANNPSVVAAFISFGKTEKITESDNSPVKAPSMKPYLCISIPSNYYTRSQDGADLMRNQLENQYNTPLMTTTLDGSGLVPQDTTTTNYLVISGSMIINALQPLSGLHNDTIHNQARLNTYLDALDIICKQGSHNNNDYKKLKKNGRHISVGGNEDGAYYMHRYWTIEKPNQIINDNVYEDYLVGYNSNPLLFVPNLKNDKNKMIKYGFSLMRDVYGQKGGRIDKVKKVPVLCCILKIGDKYCWERLDLSVDDENYGKYQWVTQEQYDQITNTTDGTPKMTIGFDPKIDDYVLGQEYDICDNIDELMNIDGKGTAIPIKYTDGLSGQLEFSILGPYNLLWTQQDNGVYTYDLDKYTALIIDNTLGSNAPLLQFATSIMIGDFKIEAKSDNGGSGIEGRDNDLVYVSELNDVEFLDEHSDSVKISTMLKQWEADRDGVDVSLTPSHPLHYVEIEGEQILEPWYGYETGEIDEETQEDIYEKPEDRYVGDYFNEYNEPKSIIDTTIKLKNLDWIVKPLDFNFTTTFKTGNYKMISYSANLKADSINIGLKNI